MRRRWLLAPLAVALFAAGLLSLFASDLPDGLERVCADLGIAQAGGGPAIAAPAPDYAVIGLDGPLATAAAGVAGVGVAFGAAWAVGAAAALATRRSGGHTGGAA